jgi:hypothetical protein
MPAILFASNNVSHFPGSVPGSLGPSFDVSRVPYSLGISNAGLMTSPTFGTAAGTITWIHFRHLCETSATNTVGNGTVVHAVDALNRLIARVSKISGNSTQTVRLTVYNGATTISVDGLIPLTEGKNNIIDLALTITGSLIKADLYINGALSATAQFGSNPNSMGKPVRLSFGTSFTSSLSQLVYFSEIIVADGDTRNARLNFLRPIAAGAATQWDGVLSAMADDDPSTGLFTSVPNERHSFEPSAYVGAQNISNLVTVTQTVRGINSPEKLQHYIRQGGINYDSPDIPIGYDLQYNIVDLGINPSTSAPFTSADIDVLEVGIRSVA